MLFMPKSIMELSNIDNKNYVLLFNKQHYKLSRHKKSKSTLKDVEKDFYLDCGLIFNSQDVPYEDISFLSGQDLIDNIAFPVYYNNDLYPYLFLFNVANKDDKLAVYCTLSYRFEDWLHNISLRTFASLLTLKLNNDLISVEVENFIEDGTQFIGIYMKFDLHKNIHECINQIVSVLLNAHSEILNKFDIGYAEPIHRCLEFEPQYYQAGLGILNYFGTIVREKYPDKNVKIKIEQNSQSVVMIVETEDGDKEIIEKLLHNYELVVMGKKEPEALLDTQLQILDLKNELRIAHVRIETQKEQLQYRDNELMDIKSLFQSVLMQNNSSTNHINFSPIISIDMNQITQLEIAKDIKEISQNINELIADCHDNILKSYLNTIANDVQKIEKSQNKDQLKESSALIKIRELIDESNKTGSAINNFLSTVANGYDNLKIIAKKYNSIAQWCGAPQIPLV